MAYRFAVAKAKSSEINPATLSIGLLALLEAVSRQARKGDVHRLRTTVRRLEVQLGTPPAKIAKSLKKLRKKAGKVRDIDVHLGLLEPPLLQRRGRNPSNSEEARSQEKLQSFLQKKRNGKRKALRAWVKQSAPLLEAQLPELIRQLPESAVTLQEARQRASRARRRFLRWTHTIPDDEHRLHQLRIRTKKERYLLEPLRNCEEAMEIAERFKQVQDAIGEWHDWATLAELAERCFDCSTQDVSTEDSSQAPSTKHPPEDSSGAAAVLQALRAKVGREYRRARRSAESARNWMTGRKISSPADAGARRRPPASAGIGPRLVNARPAHKAG